MKKKYKLFVFTLLLLIPVITYSQHDDLFKSKKKSYVEKKDTIDLDKFNDIIVIPDGQMFQKNFEKIGYFKNVMNYDTFIKGVKAAGIPVDDNERVYTETYRKYYNNYKHFLVLRAKITSDGEIVTLKLLKPDTGELFVVNNHGNNVMSMPGSIHTNRSTWDSLFNELVNYIKANSKTYK